MGKRKRGTGEKRRKGYGGNYKPNNTAETKGTVQSGKVGEKQEGSEIDHHCGIYVHSAAAAFHVYVFTVWRDVPVQFLPDEIHRTEKICRIG